MQEKLKYKLLKQSEFTQYSSQLQQFEKQFTYPLGEQKFTIQHGNENCSYFDFFISLGEPYYFVISRVDANKQEKIIAVGCAVLREIIEKGKSEKVWYLCDFKILPEYRKKSILKGLVWRHLLPFYLKSNKFIAVNMSKKENNRLISHLQRLLPIFKVNTDTLYFYEWNVDQYLQYVSVLSEIENVALIYNKHQKEILIDNQIMPLYHVVTSDRILDNLDTRKVVFDVELDKTVKSIFMFATTNTKIVDFLKNHHIIPTTEGSFIYHNAKIALDISSAEI